MQTGPKVMNLMMPQVEAANGQIRGCAEMRRACGRTGSGVARWGKGSHLWIRYHRGRRTGEIRKALRLRRGRPGPVLSANGGGYTGVLYIGTREMAPLGSAGHARRGPLS